MQPLKAMGKAVHTAFLNEEASLEERRRVVLLVGLSVIGIVFLLIFSLIALIQGNLPLFTFDCVTCAFLLLNLVHTHYRRQYKLNIHVGIVFISALYIYLYTTGGTRGTAFPWYYTYPLIAVYLLGSQRGVIASLLMLPPVFLAMVNDSDGGIFFNYTLDFEIRFIAAYLVVAFFAYLFEATGEKNRSELHTINRSLESIINARTEELTQKNIQLTRENEERRKAENAIRLSQESLVTIMDSIDATIYVADIESCEILFMNRQIKDVYGQELTGRPCWEALRNETGPCGNCLNQVLMRRLEHDDSPIVSESVHPVTGNWCVTYDRAIRWVDGRVAHLQIATDISHIKDMEAQRKEMGVKLHRAQKMEAIGTLAGGVAHDLNNVLSGIVSYPELLLMELDADSPLRGSIETIQKSGQKASDIVQDLLTLARRGVATTEVLNLNDIVAEYISSPEHQKLVSYHPDVDVRLNLEKPLWNLNGSPIHLRKTLMNLVANAAEAQPAGGEIVVATRNLSVDARPAEINAKIDSDVICLTVTDKGVGIAQEDLNRIFEPFYTRKKMGRSGTGLGMAVVWGTVEDHQGHIHVKSEQNVGTTFHLYFPATRDAVLETKGTTPIAQYLGEQQTILVVDDVEEQREIASKILTKLNYQVVTIDSGEAAIDYLRDHAVDLAVLDMIMEPGMDGLDTYTRIQEFRPNQKVIIASGFSESERVKDAQQLGAGTYVKKPYSIENIGTAIKNCLEGDT